MAKKRKQRLVPMPITENTEATTPEPQWLSIVLTEASDNTEKTGREWDVTIMGGADKLVEIDGEMFIRSNNKRLYSLRAIAESAPQWEGVKVFDNHQTPDQFEASRGMRSVGEEWLGSIVGVRWDEAKKALVGRFKVVKDSLAQTLKNADKQGVLDSVGLSVSAFPEVNRQALLEGIAMPIIDGFKKILSVDLVGTPAAGGRFDRIIAADTTLGDGTNDQPTTINEELIMDPKELTKLLAEAVAEANKPIAEALKTLTEAKPEATPDPEGEPETEPENKDKDELPEGENKADESLGVINEALHRVNLASSQFMVNQKLAASKLPDTAQKTVRLAIGDRIVEADYVDKLIEAQREIMAEADTSGEPTQEASGTGVKVTFSEPDKKAIMLMQKLMGKRAFEGLANVQADNYVSPMIEAATGYQSWVNGGRQSANFGGRTSELIRSAFLGGSWNAEDMPMQEASTLATVIKNTVNIMTAVDYAGRNRWYESIVDIIETDNPIDDLTIARLFGADTLDVVNKGAAYTEMKLQDEEEVVKHVKQGNFIEIYLEDLLADKIDYFRNLPVRLAEAWNHTLSLKVANVFLLNSGAGPTMSDSGALFNNTAVTTATGHANLRAAALDFAGYNAAQIAMRSQSARPLGTGRKLVDMGPFTILVPLDLEASASQIRDSIQQPGADGAGTTGNQSINPFGPQGGALRPNIVTVPEWTDTNDWAMVARYGGQSPIKLAFPTGQLTPQVFVANSETAGVMFTNDAIRYKLRMMTYRFNATDDCAPVADWRLLQKSIVA